jgi:hypothetical protein
VCIGVLLLLLCKTRACILRRKRAKTVRFARGRGRRVVHINTFLLPHRCRTVVYNVYNALRLGRYLRSILYYIIIYTSIHDIILSFPIIIITRTNTYPIPITGYVRRIIQRCVCSLKSISTCTAVIITVIKKKKKKTFKNAI